MTDVEGLTAWLRGQLDVDDADARACLQIHGPGEPVHEYAHQALRQVEATRRILEPLEGIHAQVMGLEDRIMGEWGCGEPDDRDVSDGLLKLLALPYDQRPGYQEVWRP